MTTVGSGRSTGVMETISARNETRTRSTPASEIVMSPVRTTPPASRRSSRSTSATSRSPNSDTARGSGRYVAGAYEWRELPGLGHFLPEEAPDPISAAIADWAGN